MWIRATLPSSLIFRSFSEAWLDTGYALIFLDQNITLMNDYEAEEFNSCNCLHQAHWKLKFLDKPYLASLMLSP